MNSTSPITTHVLDTAVGLPAEGIAVDLLEELNGTWTSLATGETNVDGRVTDLLPAGSIEPGVYRIVFATGDYFGRTGSVGFYPQVTVEFEISDTNSHYHVPLLLSPFGYSTYRGS
ncbi:MAG: hydroxyisourate hydrolase [Aeoliella sp.]